MCDGTAFKIRGRVVTSMAAWVRMSVSMLHAIVCIGVLEHSGSVVLLAVYVHEDFRGGALGAEALDGAAGWLDRPQMSCLRPLSQCGREIRANKSYQRMLEAAGWSA